MSNKKEQRMTKCVQDKGGQIPIPEIKKEPKKEEPKIDNTKKEDK